jgi:uncharacterized C2H2 Zn-finger protein
MPIYLCPKCDKAFKSKNGYNYHLKKKIPCIPVEKSDSDEQIKESYIIESDKPVEDTQPIIDETKYVIVETPEGLFTCPVCLNNYKRKIVCQKHIKYCHVKEPLVPIKKENENNNTTIIKNTTIHNVTNKNITYLIPNYVDFSIVMDMILTRLKDPNFAKALPDTCTLVYHPDLHEIVLMNE